MCIRDRMYNSRSLNELQSNYAAAINDFKNNAQAQKRIAEVKDNLKAELI